MYICPICKREFNDSTAVAKHSLACWKAANPNQKSTPAPHVEETSREASADILDFFSSFKKGD